MIVPSDSGTHRWKVKGSEPLPQMSSFINYFKLSLTNDLANNVSSV